MVSAAPDSPEALLVNAALSEELREALDGLPEAFREAVWLRDVEELTYQEIATALDVPDRDGDVAPVPGPPATPRRPAGGAGCTEPVTSASKRVAV